MSYTSSNFFPGNGLRRDHPLSSQASQNIGGDLRTTMEGTRIKIFARNGQNIAQ
jgi:hypothetical protein